MASGVNPMISGMLNALRVGSYIKQQRQQEEMLRRQKILDQRALEREQGDREQREFQNRMTLERGGYEPATELDVAEATAPRYRIGQTGGPTPTGGTGLLPAPGETTSIAQRMLDYGGRKWVRPSKEQQLREAIEQNKMLTDADAVAGAGKARKILEATGFPAPGGVPGIPQGQLLPGSEASAIINAMRAKEPQAPGAPHYETGEGGEVYRIPRTGPAERVEGIRKSLPKTATRSDVPERNLRLKYLEKLEKDERELSDQVSTIRGWLSAGTEMQDNKGDDIPLSDARRAILTGKVRDKQQKLKQVREQKVRAGFSKSGDIAPKGGNTTPKGGDTTPAKPQLESKSRKPQAKSEQVQAYADSLGIDYEEALNIAEAEGYEVQ